MRFQRFVDVVFMLSCVCLAGLALEAKFGFTKPAPAAKANVLPGDQGYADLTTKGAAKTVVLYLHPACHFCTESMPFYRRMVDDVKKRGRSVSVRAFSMVEEKELRSYLKEHSLEQLEVRKVRPPVGVRGTPTLVVLDSEGRVLESFAGKLNESQEDALIRSLAES